jgi:hypothetical protein
MTDSNLYDFIAKGTDHKEYFNYDGKAVPLRPLSTYEFDQVRLKVIREGITQTTFDALMKVKLDIFEADKRQDVNIRDYAEFTKFYNEIDYWTVYYSMKDFQDKKFTQPDYDGEFENDFEDWDEDKPKGYYIVRNMKYVHEMAKDIKTMSVAPKLELREFIRNADGKLLATTSHVFNVPLNSEAWKITPLQHQFLHYSRPGAPEIIEDKEELPGIKAGSIDEVLGKLKEFGIG